MKPVKIFTEIRYNEPSIYFEDIPTIGRIKKELGNLFTHNDFNKEQKVLAFINANKKFNCIINNDRVVVDIDQVSNLESFKSLCNSIIPYVMTELNVELTQRVGVRAHFIDPSISTEEETQKIIVDKFFNKNPNIISSNKDKSNFQPRIGFSFQSEDGYNVSVNIAYNQVGSARLERGQLKDMIVEKTFPLVDLDMFNETPKKPDQINGMLKHFIQELPKLANQVWNEDE